MLELRGMISLERERGPSAAAVTLQPALQRKETAANSLAKKWRPMKRGREPAYRQS